MLGMLCQPVAGAAHSGSNARDVAQHISIPSTAGLEHQSASRTEDRPLLLEIPGGTAFHVRATIPITYMYRIAQPHLRDDLRTNIYTSHLVGS
jgi:hypothetical protein